jgi:GNAT acetyltransferase-like protein
MMLRLETHVATEAFSIIRDEWEALHRSLSPKVPFTGPLWNELWWTHCRKCSFFSRDDLLLVVVRDSCDRLIAVAPMLRTSRPAGGPIRLREIQFFGADPNMTEIRGVVCDPLDQPRVLEQLSHLLHQDGLPFDWIRWQGIHMEGSALPDRPNGAGKFVWTRHVPDYFVEVPDSWQAFEAGLTKRVRKKLRSSLKELDRDGHKFQLQITKDPSDVPAALSDFFRLHEERTKVRSYDVFAQPEKKKFLNDYCLEMAKRDQLRIYSISVLNQIVAMRIGFVFDQELYLYHSGNAVDWDRYSIMTVLLGEIFRSAIADGLTRVNLSTGNDRSKTRWRPASVQYLDGVEIAPGFSRFAIYSIYEFLRLRGDTRPLVQLARNLKGKPDFEIANVLDDVD